MGSNDGQKYVVRRPNGVHLNLLALKINNSMNAIFSPTSHLQLAPKLVKETPIRMLSNELLRGRFDHTQLLHSESVESERILGVVLSPDAVGKFVQHLKHTAVRTLSEYLRLIY